MSDYRIITVCTGNICRSPMAEYQLHRALGGHATVCSAGITDGEQGNPIDPRAARVLARHGITDTTGHRARPITPEDFTSDLILALDTDHEEWLKQNAPDDRTRERIILLRRFDPEANTSAHHLGIADPWYGDDADFEHTYNVIEAVIPGIAHHTRGRPHLGQ